MNSAQLQHKVAPLVVPHTLESAQTAVSDRHEQLLG